ncbi:MAG: hypothetical protein J5I52_00155 [Saprospiraceae bacterium]|nr:MAG: DoxX family protein [Bacteroidetes bacterium OLB9]MCO6462534.1 hypothetical protein [Saprospiraceae bacterium]MCZ2338222.1 hypothetical protein [Chitinophagales bacterium]
MGKYFLKLFLRYSVAIGFLSACADRFGMWDASLSAWGSWPSFVEYTGVLNPWMPESVIPLVAAIVTSIELIVAICLIVGYKTELAAKVGGVLLLVFALSMAFTVGVKKVLDFSVLLAAGASFAIGLIKEKYFEVDSVLSERYRN